MHSEHVYKDSVWVEMTIRMNYCAIFWSNTHINHHRRTNTST